MLRLLVLFLVILVSTRLVCVAVTAVLGSVVVVVWFYTCMVIAIIIIVLLNCVHCWYGYSELFMVVLVVITIT